MKKGRTMNELAAEMRRINESKRDFIVPASGISMTHEAGIALTGGGLEPIFATPTSWAHAQLSDWLGVPRQYYERLRVENPELLAANANWAISTQPSDRRLVRTVEGRARALLSNRYRILDSWDLMQAVLPFLLDKGFRVESCELTERRFYLKAFSDKITAEVKVGDVVQYGISLSASDVGAGSIRVDPMLYTLACSNGMVMADSRLRKYHDGREIKAEEIQEVLTDETRRKTDEAFWLSVRDVVAHTMKDEIFKRAVERMQDATKDKITNYDLAEVVKLTAQAVNVSGDAVRKGIMDHLAEGGDLTRYGLANAFTRTASDQADYELASMLERAGGQIIELGQHEWKAVAGKPS